MAKGWLTAGLALLVALLLAACGNSTTSTGTASTPATRSTGTTLPLTAANCPSLATPAGSSTSVTAVGATTTTVPRRAFFCRKGTGKTDITGVTIPSVPKWTLAWHFDCVNVKGGKGSFAITLHPSGGKSAIKVTSQQGLGGGGSNFYASGHYALVVTTACQWTVTGYT
ncbi:MAG: hypothetical protein ACYDHU_05575 [Acidimicrobiales bacterium]